MFIFCVACPVGIGIGWLASGVTPVLGAIAKAVAAGAFIFIAATEIIVEEFSVTKHKWMKFFMLIFGIILILAVT